MRRSWLALAGFVPALACSDATAGTHTLVTLDAEQAVQLQAKYITLTITAGDGTVVPTKLPSGQPVQAVFPYIVELSPKNDDASRTYRVDFSALDANKNEIATATLISGYVAHQTRFVTLLLDDACINKPACGGNETCEDGACVSAQKTPDSLSTSPTPTSSVDAGGTLARNDAGSPPPTGGNDAGGTPPTGGSDAQVAPPTSDAQVAPVTDAQVPPAGGNDAAVTTTGACAGPYVGTYNGTIIPDTIELFADCSFQYTTPACMSNGTYSALGSPSGTFDLDIVSAGTGTYTDRLGNEYGCLQPMIYECDYDVDTTMLTYACNGQDPFTYLR